MQNKFQFHFERIAFATVRITAAVVGLAIFSGDIFFWTKGDLGGHLYSFLSLIALFLGSVAVSVKSEAWKKMAAALIALHLLATIALAALNNTWGMFSIGLIGIDCLLLLVVLRNH